MKVEELIEKVRKIDPKAAEYLEKEAPKLPRYVTPGGETSGLSGIIYWETTPQGHNYWESIARQLGEMR